MLKIKNIAILLFLQLAFGNLTYSQTWLDSADVRIEEFRKGNFGLEIKDELGNTYKNSVAIELVNPEFAWGGIVPIKDADQYVWGRSVLTKYSNYGVTGNYFKWPWIENEQGVVTYEEQDEVLDWVEKVGLGFRGHTLLWGGDDSWKMPQWTLDGTLTPEEIYAACETHIRRDVAHWKGRIDEWDVINEPSEGHETWLVETVGDSINWNSFKWAYEADSNALLFTNDYNILNWNSAPSYRSKIEEMVTNGAKVGGIGLQAHMEDKINWREVKDKLDYMAELGIPLRVTEFDMKIDEKNVSEEDMAMHYATMLRTCFSHPAVNGFVLWCFWDGAPYHPGSGIYDEDRVPKIAADSVYHLIKEEWTTKIAADTDEAVDTHSFRGFYGDYRVVVDFDGELREFMVPCQAANADSVFLLEYANSKPATANFLEARISKDADALELIFDKSMDYSSFKTSEFFVYSADDYAAVAFEEIDSVTFRLNLQDAIFNPGQFFAIYYNGDTARAENTAILNHFGPDEVKNNLPAFEYAHTDTLGEKVFVGFSETMGADIDLADFSITKNDNELTLSGAALHESDSKVLVFTLGAAVSFGDNLRITYSGDYRSADAYLVQDFGPKYVMNTVPDPNQGTALDDIDNGLKVSAFPNPFDSEISFENLENIYSIEIYSAQGSLLDNYQVLQRKRISINTSDFPTGLLFARFLNEDSESLGIMKLVKE